MKRIIIIGSRRRDTADDYSATEMQFLNIYEEGDVIISGGCRTGGDAFAERIARKFAVPITIYHAKWSLGRHAGFMRNTTVAENGDEMIACVAAERTGGTEDTIAKFKKRNPDGKVHIC